MRGDSWNCRIRLAYPVGREGRRFGSTGDPTVYRAFGYCGSRTLIVSLSLVDVRIRRWATAEAGIFIASGAGRGSRGPATGTQPSLIA